MKNLACLLFLTAACTAASDDLELSAEERAALDEELAAAGGKADGFGLSLYTSEYKNVTLAGETASGAPFALVAGKHEKNFPFFHARSEWDNVLLLVGGDALAISSRDLAGLTIAVDLEAAERGTARIAFAGSARRANGTLADITLDVTLDFKRYAPLQLGKPYNVLDLDGIAGMRWRPAELSRANAGSITIAGVASPIVALAGELEHGKLTNFRAPELAIRYDYVALAHADAQSAPSSWYGHVTFTAHALYPDSILGGVIDWYLGQTAGASLSLGSGTQTRGNDRGLALDGATVVISDRVDLGLADLDRQLVRTTDRQGRVAYGLREVFTAKAP